MILDSRVPLRFRLASCFCVDSSLTCASCPTLLPYQPASRHSSYLALIQLPSVRDGAEGAQPLYYPVEVLTVQAKMMVSITLFVFIEAESMLYITLVLVLVLSNITCLSIKY